MHDALYYSSLVFGESGSMSSEAAVLGTPVVRISYNQLGYLDDLESKYGLIYNFGNSEREQEMAIDKCISILSDPIGKKEYKQKSLKLLDECIDTTQFMVDEVLKYESHPAVYAKDFV